MKLYLLFALSMITMMHAYDYSEHMYALQDFISEPTPSDYEYELFRGLMAEALAEHELIGLGLAKGPYSSLSKDEQDFIFQHYLENFRVAVTAPHGFSLYQDLRSWIIPRSGLLVRSSPSLPKILNAHKKKFGSSVAWNDFDTAVQENGEKNLGWDKPEQQQKIRVVIRKIATLCRGHQCPTRQRNYALRAATVLLFSALRARMVRNNSEKEMNTIDWLNAWIWRRIPYLKKLFTPTK